ncbi:MAG: glycosyltransferase family 39 protein [Muribaculaceae bacterium]|nr:glycosyltransferase family 39 protein [Muribaculaceae bacterium]
MKKQYTFWLITAFTIVTFLPFLGETLFNTKGEPREAIVAVSMLQGGNWILPEHCGGDIPYKPPFLAWCIAIISSLTGSVNEYTSRMPSALAMIAMAIAGLRFYRNRTSGSIAAIMTLITITSFEVHRAATNCRVDMVLTALIVTSLYALYRHWEQGHKGLPWTAIVLMSCAVLTKGPVGMILPCLVIGVFRLIKGERFFPVFLNLFISAIMSCLVPALWYIAAYNQAGQEFLDLAMEENFGRFFGSMSYESHVNPVHYNFITVISGLLPYTLLLLMTLFTIRIRCCRISISATWQKLRNAIVSMEPVKLFSMLSIILIFTFYCIPKSKRSVYLLPIYPFLAYFITLLIINLINRKSQIIKIYAIIISIISILLPVTFYTIRMGLLPELHGSIDTFIIGLANHPLSALSRILILLPLITGIYTLISLAKRQFGHQAIFKQTLTSTLLLYWSFSAVYQPAVLNTKSDIVVAREIETVVPHGEIYSFIDDGLDFMRFYTINFYLNDRVKMFIRENPDKGYIIVSEPHSAKLMERYGNSYSFSQIAHYPHRSCDLKQQLLLLSFSKNGK